MVQGHCYVINSSSHPESLTLSILVAVRPANYKLNERTVHHTVSALGTSMESLLFRKPGILKPGMGASSQENEGQQISILFPPQELL